MRRIEFRARSAISGEILNQLYIGQCFSWVNYERQKDILIEQFTGLTDKNGVDIYEGDILKAHQKYHGCNGEFKAVSFSNYDDCEGYQTGIHSGWNVDGMTLADCVSCGSYVVGNIYENPDLIEDIE